MSLTDFYKNTTKKFNVTFLVQNAYPNITTDTVLIYFYNSGSGLIYSASADVAASGSGGTAVFNLTDDYTNTILPDIYSYEIVWNVSASSATYVADTGEVSVKNRII